MDKETARKQILVLIERYERSLHREHSEQDTATKFIKPFIEAFGWDTQNIDEFKEEYATPTGMKLDAVIFWKEKPWVAIEYKGLRTGAGPLKTAEKRLKAKSKLLEMAREVQAKYALLTRFAQSVFYNAETGEELFHFHSPSEYKSDFEILWRYLSKPSFQVE